MLGLLLNPTQPPSPAGTAIKGSPLPKEGSPLSLKDHPLCTRSGFESEFCHFIHCVVFCRLFYLCFQFINLAFLSEDHSLVFEI